MLHIPESNYRVSIGKYEGMAHVSYFVIGALLHCLLELKGKVADILPQDEAKRHRTGTNHGHFVEGSSVHALCVALDPIVTCMIVTFVINALAQITLWENCAAGIQKDRSIICAPRDCSKASVPQVCHLAVSLDPSQQPVLTNRNYFELRSLVPKMTLRTPADCQLTFGQAGEFAHSTTWSIYEYSPVQNFWAYGGVLIHLRRYTCMHYC